MPSESRDSKTVKDIFHEYKGILISDFWSACNILNVEQQKCFQHLVRELRKISMKELDKRDNTLNNLKINDEVKTLKSNDDIGSYKKRGRPAKKPLSLTY